MARKELGNVEKFVSRDTDDKKHKRLLPGEKEILKALYKEGVSAPYIAAKLGISKQAVCYQLKKMGIKIREHSEYTERYHESLFKKIERKK